jgi:hypothetical protein
MVLGCLCGFIIIFFYLQSGSGGCVQFSINPEVFMSKNIRLLSVSLFVLMFATLSCNLLSVSQPGDDLEAAETAAAQTITAMHSEEMTPTEGTDDPEDADPEDADPTDTPEAAPTTTPNPTATLTPTVKPCNRASFVTDVTIPDKTELMPGEAFTKTWRLRNNGSCTWTSGYQLVFKSGDRMSGPLSQQLTAGTVAPGGTLDISVDLAAPNSAGTYKGFWEFNSPEGETFGVSTGAIWVEIVVLSPTDTPEVVLPPAIALMTAPVVLDESGSVRSNGDVLSPENVGDTSGNLGSQAFVSFDISTIPVGATITDVEVDFSNYDTLGNPFSLGCLRMYKQDYGTLESSDWFAGDPLGAAMRWCNTGQLDVVTAGEEGLVEDIQSYVGSPRAKFRLQIREQQTNNNGVADMVRLGSDIVLIITYTLP